MAIDRRIVSTRFPYVPLTVTVQERTVTTQVLLDTGFDGDLAVPPDFVAAGTPPDGYLGRTLADGSRVEAPVYVGTIRLDSLGTFTASVTVIGDEPIAGRGLIDRFTITLDRGTRVIVEP